ncbi:hypothetical protein [Bdellovibrio svalbardensis]|uniref:DUF3592 domain-containing protein n=1 Tax=Bdellovibrio svalbardensis TaxID=2972972 RepID=A0ABT6DI12_9BACT|nr:hypothetical protein [Bdellovibrio svalbardensis]MDG0816433.1 hypothetical protein [Bdellovibrio svalbardensis]
MIKVKDFFIRFSYLIFAVIILCVGFSYGAFRKHYIETASRATGLIVEVNHPGRSCYQTYEFAYGDKKYVGTSKCGAFAKVGDSVEILYRLNGDEIQDYQVKEDSNPWDVFYLSLVVAVVVILFQWMVLIKKKTGG